MKFAVIVVVLFLVLGSFLIVKYNNYQLDNPDDAVSFVKDFGTWMFGIGKSGVSVVGAVIDESWLPEKPNETNSTNELSDTVYVVYD